MEEILPAGYFNSNHCDTVASYIAMHTNIATASLSAMGYFIQRAWNNGAAQLRHMHTHMGGYDIYRQLASMHVC